MPSLLTELRLDAPHEHLALMPFLTSTPNRLKALHLAELPFTASAVLDDARVFGELRQLAIIEDLADDTMQWLSKSPLLAQLDHVTIGGPFTDDGLDFILREFARFSRVREIVLWGGIVSRQLRTLARKQLPQLLLLKAPPPTTW
jgi:hypothetical protein